MNLTEKPQLVADTVCEVGENPLWHPDAGLVFFLDIPAGTVHAYSPVTGEHRPFSRGRVTGGMLLAEDGSLLLFQDGYASHLGLDGVQRVLAGGLCPGNDRFNDATADPEGRVFAGAMGGNGRLLRFDPDGRASEVLDGLGIPNGMGFTLDRKRMYFTDSLARRIFVFDYDPASGRLSNRRVFVEISEREGVPDGMTVDAEGYVWTAIWFGGRVKRFSPEGKLDREVHFPVTQTSAITFGGPDLTEIYVTTAATDAGDSLRPPACDPKAPRGGGLYGFRLEGIRGKPGFRARVKFGG